MNNLMRKLAGLDVVNNNEKEIKHKLTQPQSHKKYSKTDGISCPREFNRQEFQYKQKEKSHQHNKTQILTSEKGSVKFQITNGFIFFGLMVVCVVLLSIMSVMGIKFGSIGWSITLVLFYITYELIVKKRKRQEKIINENISNKLFYLFKKIFQLASGLLVTFIILLGLGVIYSSTGIFLYFLENNNGWWTILFVLLINIVLIVYDMYKNRKS